MNAFANALMAALCWGFAPFLEKAGLRQTQDPAVGVIVRSCGILIGTLCMLPFFSQLSERISSIPSRNLIYLACGGILASIAGQTFFYRALKYGEVSRSVAIGASYPIVACLLGLLVFQEPVTAKKLWGILCVTGGIVLLK